MIWAGSNVLSGVGVRVGAAVGVNAGVSVIGIKVSVGTDVAGDVLPVFVHPTMDIQNITIKRNKILNLMPDSRADIISNTSS